jgi:acetyltransferase-like isoleucine patch superfamily enzyme
MNNPHQLAHDWFPRPLPDNVQLGDRSWCYSTFSLLHFQSQREKAICIGSDSGIYNGSFFDLGPQGEVQIGNFCTLVGAIISVNCRVSIGDYCFLAHEVVLSDSFASTPVHSVGVHHDHAIVLEENCWVGMRACIIAPVRIGEGAIIGAAAVVDFDVPPYAIVAGNPASIVGWSRKS